MRRKRRKENVDEVFKKENKQYLYYCLNAILWVIVKGWHLTKKVEYIGGEEMVRVHALLTNRFLFGLMKIADKPLGGWVHWIFIDIRIEGKITWLWQHEMFFVWKKWKPNVGCLHTLLILF